MTNNFFNIYKDFDFKSWAKSINFINLIHKQIWTTIEMTDRELNTKNVEMNVKKLIAAGIPADKITIELPLKGAEFDMNIVYGINFIKFIGYNDTCKKLLEDEAANWQGSYIDNSDLAILQNDNISQAIVFESSRSIANKIRFAVKLGLAGAITGPIYLDDYNGDCIIDADTFGDFQPAPGITLHIPQRKSQSFGLIRTINEAIEITLDEIRQEKKIRDQKPTKSPSSKNITQQSNKSNQTTLHSSYIKYLFFILLFAAMMIPLPF